MTSPQPPVNNRSGLEAEVPYHFPTSRPPTDRTDDGGIYWTHSTLKVVTAIWAVLGLSVAAAYTFFRTLHGA